MGIRDKLPGMTSEPGHKLRNAAFGIVYAFLALAILGAIAGDAPDDGESTADADTGASDDEAEQAAENEVSDDDADEADTDADGSEADEADEADDGEVEAIADGGTEADTASGSGAAESAADEVAEYDGAMSPELMETVLASEGITVDAYDDDAGGVIVNYTSSATSENELARDLGAIAGAYTAMVADGYPTDELEIHIFAADGTAAGYTTLDADDAQAWHDGDMSDDEFALLVLDENMVAYA